MHPGRDESMESVLRLTTTVLPGSRVEFAASELPEGSHVEVIVVLPEQADRRIGVADYLKALPPVLGATDEWAAAEREIQDERDSWER